MRIFAALTLLLAFPVCGLAAGATQATLHDRCIAAIASSGKPADTKALHETAIPMGESGVLFQFEDTAAGTFSCQVCDDDNPDNQTCATVGLRLTFRPKDGELKDLPAELDKKCAYFLQKESKPPAQGMTIDHAMIKRIQTTPDHTDTRWVYKMELDGKQSRCVIRKSDGDFRVERQQGDSWRPIAAGVMF
jgi:hypothetical protein